MVEDKRFVEVAPSLPLPKTLHYTVPEKLRSGLEIGKRVFVPLGKRKITGYVVGFPEQSDIKNIKDILDVLDEAPLFSKGELSFYRWVSKYYFSPLGEVIKTALPKGINIETIQVFCLTEKGVDLLTSLEGSNAVPPSNRSISDGAYRVLKEVSRKKGATSKYITKRLSGEKVPGILFKLRDEGLICGESIKKQIRVTQKKERFVQYEGNTLSEEVLSLITEGLERRAPKQADILRFVRNKGKVPYQMLRKEFGDPSQGLKKLQEKGVVSVVHEEVYREPIEKESSLQDSVPKLTKEQKEALNRVLQGIASETFSPFLLFGVTGSGKTEVYLRAIEAVIKTGKEAIVLVPEISLTPQLVRRFQSRFGKNFALLHSKLSEGERYDEWWRIKKREVQIAIGVRTAIFAPFENLGIIVVDEEHETSYKQEEKLRYSARDLSLVRGKSASAVVILGSATPSLESYYNSQTGKLFPLTLSRRIDNRPLPLVKVVDMREELKDKSCEDRIFSKTLKEAIKETLEKKQQVLLFLNRRGFASFVLCIDCGFIIKCSNCSVSLVHHYQKAILHCHYCDSFRRMPDFCPECGKGRVQSFGLGTEGVEEGVKRLFPSARVVRMDRDTTGRKGAHHKILKKFEEGEIDVLIGTQMIAKGHDFPNIALVGVISADTSLGFPDFRASERTFQLLTQVAGRTGRGEIPGKVLIQTFNPEHYSIRHAMNHDFLEYYRGEMDFRKELNYPPFCRLINFRIVGNSKEKIAGYADDLERITTGILEKDEGYMKCIEILGPVTAPLERLKGKYRWQMLVKGQRWDLLHSFAGQVFQEALCSKRGRGITLSLDVDPINML